MATLVKMCSKCGRLVYLNIPICPSCGCAVFENVDLNPDENDEE